MIEIRGRDADGSVGIGDMLETVSLNGTEKMSDKRQVAEMIAEALREIGVLTIVFAPLDKLIQRGSANWHTIMLTMGLGLALLFLGINLERRR